MRIRSRFSDESGQALVMVALSLSILLGFAGLALDSSLLFRSKRHLQAAADAAAEAGALDYLYHSSASSATAAAKAVATLNGYTDNTASGGSISVTVNTPPTIGPNAGSNGSVEVIVGAPVPLSVMGVFSNFRTAVVKARGVAASPTAGSTCMWLMDPTGANLNMQGSYDIEAPGCGIYMNSTSTTAVSTTGNGGTLNVLFADAVGGSIGHQTTPTAISTYSAPRTNPWGNITGPSPLTTAGGCGSVVTTANLTLTGTITGPGAGNTVCYTQPVIINNLTAGAGTLGTITATTDYNVVTSAAGTFVFGAGVTLTGTNTIFGGTIDVYQGTFNQGNSVLNIIAPASLTNTYDGIAIMQPTSNTTGTCATNGTQTPCIQVQMGSSGQVLDGYIYAPSSQVFLQDSGGGGGSAVGIVADNMFDKTTKLTINSYDKSHQTTTRNRVLALVE